MEQIVPQKFKKYSLLDFFFNKIKQIIYFVRDKNNFFKAIIINLL